MAPEKLFEPMLDLFDSEPLRSLLSVAGVVGRETVLTTPPMRDFRVRLDRKLDSEKTDISEAVALAGGVDSGIEGGGIRVAEGEGVSFLARRCMMETFDA
jgi:hypothetical protein